MLRRRSGLDFASRHVELADLRIVENDAAVRSPAFRRVLAERDVGNQQFPDFGILQIQRARDMALASKRLSGSAIESGRAPQHTVSSSRAQFIGCGGGAF